MAITDYEYSDSRSQSWRTVEKEITFSGGTADAIGDFDGTGNPFSIFAVTGTVRAKIYAICETTLVGASATLEVGNSKNTAGIIAQSTATDIAVNEIWHDASPDAAVELDSVAAENILANGLDVIGTIGTANITAGKIKFICLWRPVSLDADVSSA